MVVVAAVAILDEGAVDVHVLVTVVVDAVVVDAVVVDAVVVDILRIYRRSRSPCSCCRCHLCRLLPSSSS